MNEYDFVLDMTPEQVERAERAGKLASDHTKGVKLYEGLDIGESLLVGREIAKRLAGVDKPNGRAYADHFLRWKVRFGFPTDRANNHFYDAAIYCAEHRSEADKIIARLAPKQRAELGIQGLFKRLRRSDGEAPPVRISPMAALKQRNKELECEKADLEERLAASEDGLFDPSKLKPDALVRMIVENCGASYCQKVLTILTQRLEEAAAKTKARNIANLNNKARKRRAAKAAPKPEGKSEPDHRSAAEAAWKGEPIA
jgi:hypothetical protein